MSNHSSLYSIFFIFKALDIIAGRVYCLIEKHLIDGCIQTQCENDQLISLVHIKRATVADSFYSMQFILTNLNSNNYLVTTNGVTRVCVHGLYEDVCVSASAFVEMCVCVCVCPYMLLAAASGSWIPLRLHLPHKVSRRCDCALGPVRRIGRVRPGTRGHLLLR